MLDVHALATLFLLIGLEIVLGVDNILVISLLVDRLPKKIRQRARITGLLFALFFRLGFIAGAFYLVKLTTPIIGHLSLKDFILIAGGSFLFWKACRELYVMIECKNVDSCSTEESDQLRRGSAGSFTDHLSTQELCADASSYSSASAIMDTASKQHKELSFFVKKAFIAAIMQIVMLDILFSIDSVITAVGLTSQLATIFIAVIFSFAALLFYVGPVGDFILQHLSLKILALSFLVIIGGSLVMEGLGYPLHRNFLYFGMSFSFIVELLQMRYHKNKR